MGWRHVEGLEPVVERVLRTIRSHGSCGVQPGMVTWGDAPHPCLGTALQSWDRGFARYIGGEEVVILKRLLVEGAVDLVS